MKAIDAENLSAGYGITPVWHDATFSIAQGEFVGILGPNGSGKTTLFRILLGLTHPLAGTVSVLGEHPKRGNPKIGYVPQRRVVDDESNIEVLEVVRLGFCGNRWGFGTLSHAKKERAEALEALRLVGAENLAHRPLGALSGGEMQRIFLAQALAGKPNLLLLDEPLANLDMRFESNLVKLVHDVARDQGVTVLLIAHGINPLLPVLDRVIYITNGKIAIGTPEEVMTSASLSALYGSPVEVLRDSVGRLAVIGTEEIPEHHHV